MNVTQEKIDDLNAVIKVKLTPEDYRPKYEATLKDYSRKAQVKGFRPGHVPMAMIKKMYGKSILADEVNKLLNDSLYNYINENNLEVLGNPLPIEDQQKVEFHENAEMEFRYEIGFAPKIDLNLSGFKVPYQALKVDDEMLNKQIDDLRRRYGKLVNAEESIATDMLFGKFEELDENGSLKEGGISNTSTISIEFLKDEATKKQLTGKKPGDVVDLDPRTVSQGESDLAAMLGVEREVLADLHSKFRFTINEIKRIELAELNAELFDKLFGAGTIATEEDFRNRVSTDLKNMFSFDSDRLFLREATKQLLDNLSISLPDSFLKKWIVATNEKPITDEQLEKDYPSYARGLKWQLIENKIIKDNEIKVGHEEAVDYTKGYLVSQYNRYGLPAPEEDQLNQSAMRILSNKEEAKRVYDELYSRKVLAFLKDAMNLAVTEHVYDEFMKIAGAQDHNHDHDHDHDHEHEHGHEHHHHH
ncbi:MAG: trigger factor [Flavobacteriales bacterium]